MGLRHYFINVCVNTFFEHGTYMLLVHRYIKFLIYALSMYMTLHSVFQDFWHQSKDIIYI